MLTTAVILAAGHGKRMRSRLPKVLHPLAGRAMIHYCIDAAAEASGSQPVVVVGVGAEQVQAEVDERARFAVQREQLGTAHALASARQPAGEADLILLTTADMPLLTAATLSRLVEEQRQHSGPITMLTVTFADPHGFGRVVRRPDGQVAAIVEEAQATPEQLGLRELNASVYCFRAEWLWPALEQVKKSPKGEYYLTDLVEIAVQAGLSVQALQVDDPEEAIGINHRGYLAEAEAILRRRINNAWLEAGVTLVDPNTAYIGPLAQIGADTTIYPNTHLRGRTVIGRDCHIGPNSLLADALVGDGCRVLSSVLEGGSLPDGEQIGPFVYRSEPVVQPAPTQRG